MDAWVLETDQVWMEKDLSATEALGTQSYLSAVRQTERVLRLWLVVLDLLFFCWIERNIALLLLYLSYNLALCRCVKHMTRTPQLEHEVFRHVAASHISAHDGMGQRKSLIYRNSVRHP